MNINNMSSMNEKIDLMIFLGIFNDVEDLFLNKSSHILFVK